MIKLSSHHFIRRRTTENASTWTKDRNSLQRPQGFHPKKGKLGNEFIAALGEGGGDAEASSSTKETKREMSEDEDMTEELVKIVLVALASHCKGNGKFSSKDKSSKGKGKC